MYQEEGTEKAELASITLSDLRAKSNRMNRIELKVPIAVAYCNVKLPHGHVSPITFDNSKSKL